MKKKRILSTVLILVLLIYSITFFTGCKKQVVDNSQVVDSSTVTNTEKKEPTQKTIEANKRVYEELDFNDHTDFENAKKGLIAEWPDRYIKDEKGNIVYDFEKYSYIKGEAPDSANPSLWRQGELNAIQGLYKVKDGIYQIRGFDLAQMSLIEGENGWIIVDPLITKEAAKAGLDFANEHLGERPVTAVIYSHSHVDHFGGVKGVTNEEDVKSGKVKIIAPPDFTKLTADEMLIAGNAMSRRGTYHVGSLIPGDEKGNIGTGLANTYSIGEVTYIQPTDIITETGQEMIIDGVKFEFQIAMGAEAPTEFIFYMPEHKALFPAEEANHSLHNVYTLRGAKVRDALEWSKILNNTIELFGDEAEVSFAPHHWPTWGNAEIKELLKNQRDVYKYIHDQTMRLANMGYNKEEIAEMVELPESLSSEFYNRGYYGSVNHDVKAVYQFYLGWFDGNPANLHQLPPKEGGKKYVEFMGGADNVIKMAKESFDKGEYRWVAEVMSHVVFADPANQNARNLEADALEQLGYMAESGTWRNFYLTGASELRNGMQKLKVPTSDSADLRGAVPMEQLFDYLAIKVNPEKAEGKEFAINFNFTDLNEKYVLALTNSVLNTTKDKNIEDANLTLTISKPLFLGVVAGKVSLEEQIKAGNAKLEGNAEVLGQLVGMIDEFDFWFEIVAP